MITTLNGSCHKEVIGVEAKISAKYVDPDLGLTAKIMTESIFSCVSNFSINLFVNRFGISVVTSLRVVLVSVSGGCELEISLGL